MNYITPEQIKAYVNQNPTGIAGMSEDLATMVNHFAELIVRECAKVAEEYDCNLSGNGGEILEHFGVEE